MTENPRLIESSGVATAFLYGFIGLALCFGFFETWIERREAVDAADSHLSSLAEHRTRLAGGWVSERVASARLVADEPENWDNPAEVSSSLFSHRSFSGYSAVCVYDSKDRPLVCSPSHAAGLSLRDAARLELAGGKALVLLGSGPADCLLGARVAIPIRSSARSGSDAASVVVWDDPADTLFPALRGQTSPLGATEIMLAAARQDGPPIFLTPARFQESGDFLAVPIQDRQLAARAALQGSAPFGRFTDYAGTEVFAAVRPVPGTGWGIVATLPASSVFASSREHLVINWLLVAALIVLGILAHAFWQQHLRRIRGEAEDAKASLVGSRETLAIMTRAAQDGIIMMDDQGRITFWNESAARMFGWSGAEALGRQVHDLIIPPEPVGAHAAGMARWRAAGQGAVMGRTVEVEALRRDGSRFPVQLSLASTRINSRWNAVAILRDATEAKAALARIAASEESFRVLYESSRDAIMTLAPPSWRFTDCNAATVALFRTGTRKRFASMGPWELSPPTQPDGEPSASKARRMIEGAMRDGSAFFEWAHRTLDGRDFPATVLLSRITVSGKTLLQATVRDISAAKTSLERLNQLNACLLERSTSAEENIIRILGLCGRFFGADYALYCALVDGRPKTRSVWNDPGDLPGDCAAAGSVWSADGTRGGEPEVFGAPPAAPLPDADPVVVRHGLKTVFKAAVKGPSSSHGFVCAAFRRDWSATEEDRRLLGILASAIAFEEEHASLGAKFLQAQKMEAVGRLAGGVAHDFNNILTAIRGYAEFLQAGLGRDDARREDAREILAAAERASALTAKLLAFSRKQVLSFVPCDLNELVRGMRNMMERLLGEDIRLVTSLQPSIPAVRIDPGQFEQTILNLAVNARDAMPKGGVLTISTSAVSHPGPPGGPARIHSKGPWVLLTVSDTGTGMSREVMAHLFEPFFTTKERGRGTGLGLPMIYGLVRQCGGDISVNSAPGRGTAWSIFLPASPDAVLKAAEPAAPEESGPQPADGKETILLVEDEPAVLSLSHRILKEAGYTVLEAASGEEALRTLASCEDPVHLLLTDVIMPGMDGRALDERVRTMRPGIKTLFASGYTDDIIGSHGILEEGMRLLHKPFDRTALLAEVRAALDEREARRPGL